MTTRPFFFFLYYHLDVWAARSHALAHDTHTHTHTLRLPPRHTPTAAERVVSSNAIVCALLLAPTTPRRPRSLSFRDFFFFFIRESARARALARACVCVVSLISLSCVPRAACGKTEKRNEERLFVLIFTLSLPPSHTHTYSRATPLRHRRRRRRFRVYRLAWRNGARDDSTSTESRNTVLSAHWYIQGE